jgi:hypothetical protein
MSILKVHLPIGLGDILYAKGMLDRVKDRYSEIHIRLYREIIASYAFDPSYNKFLDDISELFFSETPYILTSDPAIPFYGLNSLSNDNHIPPVIPDLRNLLCKGTPLKLDKEYIAIVTKVRYMSEAHFLTIAPALFEILQLLSVKYKIVILGEKIVEMNGGYKEFTSHIYSIYRGLIENLPLEHVIDLSIPALGITAPNLIQIQQDCLIMSQAKFVITIGVGGGFAMATSVANTIGYRTDQDIFGDILFSQDYARTIVTKDWNKFLVTLRKYL